MAYTEIGAGAQGIGTMRDPYAEKATTERERPLSRSEKLIAEAVMCIEMRITELADRLRPVMSNHDPGPALAGSTEMVKGAVDADPRSEHVRALDSLVGQLHEHERRLGVIIERIEV